MEGFAEKNARLLAQIRARDEARQKEQQAAERQRRNLASRAKRKGLSPDVLAYREWLIANPIGFEIG